MKRLLFAVVTCIVLAGTVGSAYVLFSDRWPDGSIVMQLQLGSSGTLSDGSSSWGESAEAALASWNNYLGRVQFRVVRDSSAATGNGNGTNNVFWSSSIYGSAFDSNTLAVTTHWLRGSTRTEADVIFNTGSTFSWNSYSGSLVRASSGRTLID